MQKRKKVTSLINKANQDYSGSETLLKSDNAEFHSYIICFHSIKEAEETLQISKNVLDYVKNCIQL